MASPAKLFVAPLVFAVAPSTTSTNTRQDEKQQTTNKSTDHLKQDVHTAVLTIHTTSQEAPQCDSGVDVATTNTTDGVGHSHDGKSEGQSRSYHSGDIVHWITT